MTHPDDISPIRKQYLEIKRQHQDAILFFRLGDFYETFDQDAEITSRELDIVLTSRNVAKGVRIPMAGIPYHAVENYLARLIERGYHVAICEQIGDQPVKGIFPRQVVRIVTPGTLVEPSLLPGNSNNYLLCAVISEENNQAGIAFVDITTGEFAVTELRGENIFNLVRAEIHRIHPSEILHPEFIKLTDDLPGHLSVWPNWRFESGRCYEALIQHFMINSLDGFGMRDFGPGIQAAGGILQYIRQVQPSALKLLIGINTYQLSDFMVLDAATRRNLELTESIRGGTVNGSLLGILDHTITPMGARVMQQWVSKPLLDVVKIRDRQDVVELFFDNGLLRAEIRSALKNLGDLERLANRIAGNTAIPRDMAALRGILRKLPGIEKLLSADEPAIHQLKKTFDLCSEQLDLLETSLADEPPATLQNVGVIRPGFSAELDGIIERSRSAREWIAGLENLEKRRTGIKSLKVGFNKVFGYYIEITRANTDQAPGDYIRKQTLVNAERYITADLKEYEALVLNAEERIREIEARIFREICVTLSSSIDRMVQTARVIGDIDSSVALAEVAAHNNYSRPVVDETDLLSIIDGRHPVVEQSMINERFVPNDTKFYDEDRIQIITGPNMSGKSTYLRQVALIVLMAQMGSFVPATSAIIGVVDRIFTRIGAQDEIHSGQSTFMVEMIETANILHHATSRSLLILDEIGRGTSTYDGVSIAWSVVEYIHNHPKLRSKTLFATHYHELMQLAELLPAVSNRNVAVSEADSKVIFLHKIVNGGADRSYGIHVGQMAGLPRPVVQRAGEILQQLENSSGKTVQIQAHIPRQMTLFPETNPLLDELQYLDINTLSPIEALNKIYEWRKKYLGGALV